MSIVTITTSTAAATAAAVTAANTTANTTTNFAAVCFILRSIKKYFKLLCRLWQTI